MTFSEVIIKRMNGLIETANKNSAWEMEAAAEMMKAVHLLTLVADHGIAQTILEALKPFAALGMPRGGAVDTARVDIWERANHGDTRVLLTSPSQQGGSVTLSTADFRAAHDALAATQQSPRLAEQLYRRVITKDRIYYEPAERQQSPRLEREALEPFAALVPAAFDHSYPDDAEIVLSYNGEPHAVLKNIDFRRAKAALALLSPDTTVVSSTPSPAVAQSQS